MTQKDILREKERNTHRQIHICDPDIKNFGSIINCICRIIQISKNIIRKCAIAEYWYIVFYQIKNRLSKEVTKAGKIPTTETVYCFLIERARANMHLIMCMSPIGDAFRNRLRQYPSLINCTTIDWFLEWPREALLEVGNKFLMNLNLTLTITGENKVVGTPFPFPRDRFHSIRFLRSTRVFYHQSSTLSCPVLLADHFGESDYFPIYGLPHPDDTAVWRISFLSTKAEIGHLDSARECS